MAQLLARLSSNKRAMNQLLSTGEACTPSLLLSFPLLPEGLSHDLRSGVLPPLCTFPIFPQRALASSPSVWGQDPLPGPKHTHGRQAEWSTRAGCKTRAINYLSSLFLKISSQGNDPKKAQSTSVFAIALLTTAKHKQASRRGITNRPTRRNTLWGLNGEHMHQGTWGCSRSCSSGPSRASALSN